MIPELNVFYGPEIMIAGIELVSTTSHLTKVDKQILGINVHNTRIKTKRNTIVTK